MTPRPGKDTEKETFVQYQLKTLEEQMAMTDEELEERTILTNDKPIPLDHFPDMCNAAKLKHKRKTSEAYMKQ